MGNFDLTNLKQTIQNAFNKVKTNTISFLTYFYNKQNKTFLGRNAQSWLKILLFYMVFYSVLAMLFSGLLSIFFTTLDWNIPKYYGESSAMANRIKLNPGLGFRPQLYYPEHSLISYEINSTESHNLATSLKNYLERNNAKSNVRNCDETNTCIFDYKQVIDSTPCDLIKNFGYSTLNPCVVIKLNRIYGWKPIAYENTDFLPFDKNLILNDSKVLEKNIFILCDGNSQKDRELLSNSNILYYSLDSKKLNINKIGLIPFQFYPYLNQPGYKSPLVFVHFINLPSTQVSIICRAYASNIDSNDRVKSRGMVKFDIKIGNK